MAILFVTTYKFVFVSGHSMNETIKDKHLGLLHKNTKIEENDIICAQISDDKVIKRIIATHGDTIQIEKGIIYKNDAPIAFGLQKSLEFGPITLKQDQYFIIGDNYAISEYYVIHKRQIIGELLF